MGEPTLTGSSTRWAARLAGSKRARLVYDGLVRLPLVGRPLQAVAGRLLPRGTHEWVRIRTGPNAGLQIQIDPRYEVVYWQGNHEPVLQRELTQRLRPGDTVYDVGAHIGFFTLMASRLVGSMGRVVAVEPDAQNAARIRQNLVRNGIAHADILERAAWHEPTTLTFHRAPDASSRNTGSVDPQHQPSGVSIQIQTTTIDDIAAHSPAPTLIKLDVEAADVEAIRGARETLRLHRPVVIVEIHREAFFAPIAAIFADAGYGMRRLETSELPFPSVWLAEPKRERAL